MIHFSKLKELRLHQKSYLCFLGLVLMSPRTLMSEKSILNLLSSVAILT